MKKSGPRRIHGFSSVGACPAGEWSLCVDDLCVCTDKKIGQRHGCNGAAGVASATGRGESRFAGLLSKRVPAYSWLERLGFHCGADFGGRTLAWAGLSHQLFKHVITLRRPAHTEHISRGAHPEGIRGVSGRRSQYSWWDHPTYPGLSQTCASQSIRACLEPEDRF